MSSSSPLPQPKPAPDPDLIAAEIAHAERRRATLERLTNMAMALAQEITTRHIDSPYHPEPVHEPGRAFAQASRAVRLTVVLEARMGAAVFALRNGVLPSAAAMTLALNVLSRPAAPRRERTDDDNESAADEREALGERTRECLIEQDREEFTADELDAVFSGDFDAVVETIRADLGLGPDAALAEVEEGIVAKPDAPENHRTGGDRHGRERSHTLEPAAGEIEASASLPGAFRSADATAPPRAHPRL